MADTVQNFCEIILIFVGLTVFVTICNAEICVKDATSKCKCSTSKGDVIDLKPLASKTGIK
jgi:hypothetical protein